MPQGFYGDDFFAGSPYGGILDPFGLSVATAPLGTTVLVTFTDLLDYTYTPNTLVSNYSIPGLTILSIVPLTASTLLFTTSPQASIVYTVTATTSRGLYGQPLDPSLASVNFLGNAPPVTMTPVAVSPTKVRAVFAQAMLNNAALSSPSSYAVTDMLDNPLTVVSATPEQPTNPVSVALVLSTPLETNNAYQLTVSSIVTETSLSIVPSTVKFTWVQEMPNPILIQFDEFTGEVADSIFGNPNGLVFFSPALNTSTPNSTIQVKEVDVCTTAFDTYTQPQPIDPIPLYTFGAGMPTGSVLGPNGASLWAPFPRLFEAQTNLSNYQDDVAGQVTDGMVTAIFQDSTWNLSYVALLNNPAFLTFRPPPAAALPYPPPPATVPVTPVLFITANNLSPIPPVTTETIRFLSFQLVGHSTMTATLTHAVGLHASIVANSSLIKIPLEMHLLDALATVEAHADVKGAGDSDIAGGSSLSATLTVGP